MIEPQPRQVKTVLIGAKALISTPEAWIQKTSALDAKGKKTPCTSNNAVCWCALGAIWRAVEDAFPEKGEHAVAAGQWALKFLEKVITGNITMDGKKFWVSESADVLLKYNDSHSHDDVMGTFDKAIAKLVA